MSLVTSHLPWHSYNSLSDYYDSYYTNVPPVNNGAYANNEGNSFSFGLRSACSFYVDMYDMSLDSKWLVRLFELTDHILNQTDEARVSRGEITIDPLIVGSETANMYWQAPFPLMKNGTPSKGWSSYDGVPTGGGLRNQVLQDGQILNALSNAADYVLRNNITAYTVKANELLDHCELVIAIHQASWREGAIKNGTLIQGSYFYPSASGEDATYSAPVSYNHCGGIMHSMLVIHHHRSNASYLAMINLFMGFIRDTRVDNGDTFFFKYKMTGSGSEDINHGSYYLSILFSYAYDNGYLGITSQEMTKYANSVMLAKLDGKVGSTAEKFDGTGVIPDGEAFNMGNLSYFGKFNSDVYPFSKEVISTRYIAAYLSMLSGYASFLRYTPESTR